MPVTRSKLIKRIASANGLADREAATALTAIIRTIAEGLDEGCRVEVRGFGVFGPRERSARLARNPKTGKDVQTDSRKSVHFKAGKQLSALLNDEPEALSLLREKQERQRRLRDERAGQLSLF